ncbi:uncharacterized protein LOC121381272 isoform X2 [Gigantopelta aegis]|uniref:uncharacterized protein LOC121381272 isoform X2 n=1 Tax=Gigantopelta aegis TaxID=1735272 RepID=UPI001B88A927|nr:uncharacterized protein LOC121381272 isoform X2 [Gigantopelta aegis]
MVITSHGLMAGVYISNPDNGCYNLMTSLSVDLLSELLEYQLMILGIETSENQQRTWDAILAIRAKLNTAKFKRQELFLLMSSVEKLVHDAGEVAFIAGSEYSATCSAERLQSAKIQIGLVREGSSAAEKRLQDLEIQVIEKTSKHEQKKTKQDKESDDVEAETENVSEDNMPMSTKDAKSTEDFMSESSEESLIT